MTIKEILKAESENRIQREHHLQAIAIMKKLHSRLSKVDSRGNQVNYLTSEIIFNTIKASSIFYQANRTVLYQE